MLSRILSLLLLLTISLSEVASAQEPTSDLQPLVNQLGDQIRMIRQRNGRDANERTQQLAIALDRWNNSTKTAEDVQQMREWLQESLQSSLPGATKSMPQLPWFAERIASPNTEAAAPVVAQDTPALPETIEPAAPKPVTPPKATTPEPSTVAEQASPATDASKPVVPESVASTPPVKPEVEPKQEASVWQRHPSAKPIDLGNPFADDETVVTSERTSRVAMRPAGLSKSPVMNDVDINVAELNARVQGYVHGLRGVEAKLVSSRSMTLSELMPVIRELDQLAKQRDFVEIYLDAVELDHPGKTPELPTLSRAKALAGERLSQLSETDRENAAAIETLEAKLEEM
ncbi:hypothetical protein [Aeoliella sp. SH292]|uniref:hypothetical protein n=1 Tax=Aeoliella sp. SH292 TaxID=3454464 RepID=UPI003F999014